MTKLWVYKSQVLTKTNQKIEILLKVDFEKKTQKTIALYFVNQIETV